MSAPAFLGVPPTLHSWWSNVDPQEFEAQTVRSGRSEVLVHIADLLPDEESELTILDLGCGPGLLAKEAQRPDIVGIDFSLRMLGKAREWMDVVLPENILEFFPSEPYDVVVLCNVLEPYSSHFRSLCLKHVFAFLKRGGRVIIVIATGSRDNNCVGDLSFPKPEGGEVPDPDWYEDEMSAIGFDVESIELVEGMAADSSALPGDEAQIRRERYIVIIGERPMPEGSPKRTVLSKPPPPPTKPRKPAVEKLPSESEDDDDEDDDDNAEKQQAGNAGYPNGEDKANFAVLD